MSEKPEPGDLVWYEDETILDGETIEYRYATIYEKDNCNEPVGFVHPVAIDVVRDLKNALLRIAGHHTNRPYDEIAQEALAAIPDRVRIERSEG